MNCVFIEVLLFEGYESRQWGNERTVTAERGLSLSIL